MRNEEYRLQCQVIKWLGLQYPNIKTNADCGGQRYGSGLQAILRGKRMKAMGHSKGYPDLEIPKPKYGCYRKRTTGGKCIRRLEDKIICKTYCHCEIEFTYHGLYIEFKSSKGKISPEQQEWLDYLNNNGYKALVCRSFDEAIAVITEYLS